MRHVLKRMFAVFAAISLCVLAVYAFQQPIPTIELPPGAMVDLPPSSTWAAFLLVAMAFIAWGFFGELPEPTIATATAPIPIEELRKQFRMRQENYPYLS